VAYTILFRRGTDNEWTQANPILRLGEMGFVTDTRRLKVGDGITPWNSLPYNVASLTDGKIPLDQLPDYVKISVNEVSTIAQRDLLDAQSGDLAIVAETNKTYVYDDNNWVEFLVSPDLTGYATEQYVIDSIDNLNLAQYVTTASTNFIVDSAINTLNINQYATQAFVSASIASLDLPDSALFQVDYQDQSIIVGKDIPLIGDQSSGNYLYIGVTGFGEDVFTSSSAILAQYPGASAVFYSTGIGTGSMSASYLNSENTAVGYGTLIKGGFQNVAIGTNALSSIEPDPNDNKFLPSTSKANTGVGHHSLFAVTTGTYNTALGHNSLINAATGHSNIAIGADSLRYTHDGQFFDGQNAIAIGASATVPGNNVIKIGNGNHVVVTDNPIFRYSDERDMTAVSDITYGLDFINALRPVEYQSDVRNGEEVRNQLGFVASEVASASAGFTGYLDFDSEGNSDIKALAFDQFVPPIVKSIQEVDLRLVSAESSLETVAALSASVAALSASVAVLNEGDAVYETFTLSSVGTEYFVSASAGEPDPTITLVKGRRYRFDVTGVNSAQPIALRESTEVTNEVVGATGNDPVNGVSGASSSNYIFYSVPLVPSYTSLIYQSVNTPSMGGVINLVDP
jgi:hypothetical protein